MSIEPQTVRQRPHRSAGPLLLVLALLAAPEAGAQIVNVQALFDEEAPAGLSGAAEASVDWRTGSTDLLVARGLVLGQWRAEKHAMLGLVRGEYGFASGDAIVNKFLEHVRYRYRFTDWLAGEAFAQHEYDAFRRLRLRALVGAGPRFLLLGTETLSLTVGVAMMLEHEQLRNDGAPDAGEQRTDPRLSSYVIGRVKMMENVHFVETLYVQPRVTDWSDVRLLNETLLSVEANKRLTFTTGLVITYDAAPPATVSNLDTQVRTAIGVKF